MLMDPSHIFTIFPISFSSFPNLVNDECIMAGWIWCSFRSEGQVLVKDDVFLRLLVILGDQGVGHLLTGA